MTLRRVLRITREIALSVTAIVGALCLLGVVLAVFFGIHPLFFRSGSMSPTINTGDLAFAQNVSASSLHKGDIASVVEPDGTRVTHRVVTNTPVGNMSQLTLKGDANKVVDPQVYDVTKAEKVFVVIPKVGYIIGWFSQSPGSFVLAGYFALMAIIMFRRGGGSKTEAPPSEPGAEAPETAAPPVRIQPVATTPTDEAPSRRRHRKLLGLAATAALVVAVGVGWDQSTWAYWTGTATANGTTFKTAATWVPSGAPTVSCGAVGKKSVTINWTAVTGATSYDLYYPNSTTLAQNVTTLTFTFSGVANVTGTFTVRARNSTGAGPASNTVTYNTGTGSSNGTCS